MISSLFGFINDTTLRIVFGVILLIYFLLFIIFFKSIDEPWYEFLLTRKPRNWKEFLRDEAWDLPHHCSTVWGIPELVGDHDANHGYHILKYRECYLPWDKIEEWLNDKKGEFNHMIINLFFSVTNISFGTQLHS